MDCESESGREGEGEGKGRQGGERVERWVIGGLDSLWVARSWVLCGLLFATFVFVCSFVYMMV